MHVEVTTPDDHVGDVMGDISSRRGRVQSSESKGGNTVIAAQVPMAAMLEYASVLTSMTAGQGAFEMHFSHYDPAPAHVQEKVIAEAAAKKADGE
jgi:elongation factor G